MEIKQAITPLAGAGAGPGQTGGNWVVAVAGAEVGCCDGGRSGLGPPDLWRHGRVSRAAAKRTTGAVEI